MRNLTIVFILVTAQAALGQLPVPADSVYQLIKTNSVFRKTANWAEIDRGFRSKLDSAANLADTMKAFTYVFAKLDDPHSAIYFNNQYYGYYRVIRDEQTRARIRRLFERIQKENNVIKTRMLAKGYVYVQVPGNNAMNPGQVNAIAQALNDSVCKYQPSTVKGFIIDLRLNGGGNLLPMLSGLSALLGEGYIGGQADPDGEVTARWSIQKNNYLQGGYPVTDVQRGCRADFSKHPVVLLLSGATVSSGSMTAIAFKGRPKTWFIGEPTGNGYTTGNSWYALKGNFNLNLATFFVADRKGNVYKTTVDPDQTIAGEDNFDHLSEDEKVKAATAWLNKNSR
jgi:C-terminal processing protease CtpA/Prc